MASQGENLIWATAIMVAFAAGVSTLILGLGLGAKNAIRSRANSLRSIAEKSKPMMGVLFIGVGLMILFGVHHMIDAWAIEHLPYWFQDLSVAL